MFAFPLWDRWNCLFLCLKTLFENKDTVMLILSIEPCQFVFHPLWFGGVQMYYLVLSQKMLQDNRDFAFFAFEQMKHQPRPNLHSYLVLQRRCNEATLSPGIDAFWY